MIEIELKLQVDKLPMVKNLPLIKQKRVVDIYYDTEDYALLKSGNFLRNRDNRNIDFKLNIGDLSHTFCKETNFKYDGFHHNNDVQGIFKEIGIPYNKDYHSFEEFLTNNNLKVLAIVDKERHIYKLDDLEISLDKAIDIGNFIEIEYDLPDGTKFDKEQLTQYMIDKVKKAGLITKYTRVNIGYVELYLKAHNRTAYELGIYKD